MYEFWYDYVKSKYGEKAKLCYMDRDSLIVYIKTKTFGKNVETTTIHRIFEANSSFHVKQHTTGKVQFLFCNSFLLVLAKFSFWKEDWALG